MGSFRSIRQRLRRIFIPPHLVADVEAIRETQGRILSALNRERAAQPLSACEFRIYSQWGEDGILQKLTSTIPMANRTFIEFGVENFAESNCRFLMVNGNWSGYVLDGSERWIRALNQSGWLWKYDLRAQCAVIRRDNINQLLQQSGFDRDLGVLSIDVDGMDYWLFDALTAVAPRILVIEYNSVFGPDRNITVPYHDAFSRRGSHASELYYGASLGALTHLAARKGYSLVGTESAGVNAFFVRNDVMGILRALPVHDAYTEAKFRQSLDASGALSYLRGNQRLDAIRGLPVVNVETGLTELL